MRSTGDADTFIQALPDQAVHLLVTDPPWRMYAGERYPNGKDGTLKPSDRFLKAAPYGLLSLPTISDHLGRLRRAMVHGGHAYVFLPSGEYFEPGLRGLVDKGWTFLRLLIWDKAPHGGFGLGSTWRGSFEPIAVLSNGPPPSLPTGPTMAHHPPPTPPDGTHRQAASALPHLHRCQHQARGTRHRSLLRPRPTPTRSPRTTQPPLAIKRHPPSRKRLSPSQSQVN